MILGVAINPGIAAVIGQVATIAGYGLVWLTGGSTFERIVGGIGVYASLAFPASGFGMLLGAVLVSWSVTRLLVQEAAD